ncbi:MAG: signal peptidase II [Pseudomonadota bacterium]
MRESSVSVAGVDPMQKRLVRTVLWLDLSILVIVLDLWTKSLAVAHLSLHQPVAVFPHFNLMLAYNSGAAFSFLADAGGWQRWFFAGIAVALTVFMTAWIWQLKAGQRWLACALALVIGGALGNLWDRVTLGYVVDFLDVWWGDYHFPAFNIADSAITVGALMLIGEMLFNPEKNEEKSA